MKLILFNNRLVKDAKISILSGISRGYGIFETLKTLNKIPLQKKEHLNRLVDSAKKIDLKIKYKKREIGKMLDKIAKRSLHKNQCIKILALEKDLTIISVPLKINPKIYLGINCKSVQCKRSLPEIKSISYLPSFLSHEKAVKDGYFEAILTDEKNEIYEGAYSNIFWFRQNTLYTRRDSVLPGITRSLVIKISPFKIKYNNIKLSDLKKASEVFMTTSLSGIIPITKIDKTRIANGHPGTNTKKLMEILNQYLASSVS